MRKFLIPIVALFALCGCDNAEDYSHPENKKNVDVPLNNASTTASPAVATNPQVPSSTPSTSTTPADTSSAPTATPTGPRDTSAPKTGDTAVTGSFENLNVGAALECDVTLGGPTRVNVECSSNSFNDIKFDVKDNTLNITTRPSFNASTAKIHIVTPKLSSVTTGSSALVKVGGVSGATFNVYTSGSSCVEATGTADNVSVSTSGASLVKLKGVEAKTGTISSAEKSVIEVKVTESINATSNGESVINVTGSPRRVDKHKNDKSFINVS